MKPLFFAVIGILISIQSMFGQIITPGSGVSSNQVINISTNNAIARNGGHGTNTAIHNFLSIQSLGSVNSPYFSLKNTNSSSNQKDWRWSVGNSGTLQLQAENDAGTVNTVGMTATRASTNLSSLNWFFPNIDFVGGTVDADDFTVGGISIVNSTNSGIARLNGFGTNTTIKTKLTVPDGDVIVSDGSGTNHVSINASYNADAILNVQNHSTANDQKTINAVSTLTLDRSVVGEWSAGHFGYHIHHNGFDWNGIMFPNDSSYNMDGTGNTSTLYTHQFSATFGSSWNGRGTNIFMLHNRLSYDSTNASVLKDLRGLNFSWTRGGNSTVEKEQYIVLPDFVIPFSTHAAGIYSLINPASGVTFINDQGGASNYWSGDHRFDGTEYLRNGSAASPSIAFLNSPTTGFYRKSDGAIGITHLGTNFFSISALGVLTPTNTDVLDIGTSALEYRNIYASNITIATVTGIGRLAIGSNPATNLNTLIGLPYQSMIGWRRTDNSADGAWIGYSNGFFQIFTSTGSGTEPTLKQVITASSITNSVATTINGALTVAGSVTTTSSGDLVSANDVYVAAGGALRSTRFQFPFSADGLGKITDTGNLRTARVNVHAFPRTTVMTGSFTASNTNGWILCVASSTLTLPAASTYSAGDFIEVTASNLISLTIHLTSGEIDGAASDIILVGPKSRKIRSNGVLGYFME